MVTPAASSPPQLSSAAMCCFYISHQQLQDQVWEAVGHRMATEGRALAYLTSRPPLFKYMQIVCFPKILNPRAQGPS